MSGDIAAELTEVHAAYLASRKETAALSAKRRAIVVRAHDEGWSVYRIARHLGVHDNVVSAILRAAEKQKDGEQS